VTPRRVLVIGYGNTLRRDDGFGPIVAARLRERVQHPQVKILTRQLLSVELVTDLEQADLCVLVDAATTGATGQLDVREVEAQAIEVGSIGHDLSAASLLGLTQQLMGRSPKCILHSTLPASMDLGEELTQHVAALVGPTVDTIARLIGDYLAD